METGALMSYGVNLADVFRDVAAFVDQVARGGKAGDIPMRARWRRSRQRVKSLSLSLSATVETGIVPSLARPGGNITGVSLMASAPAGKSVELFRDMLPSVRRVGVLGHATNPVFAKAMLDEVLLAGGPTGIEIEPVVMIGGIDELDNAFSTMVRERADAVVIQGSLAIKPVTDMAMKYRMPSASTARAFAEIGGLMSFGADGPASFRHGAKFVHRILQGSQPKDLPIEQPTKFELIINLKTAKAMGLAIPETFLLRADAVLE
jgi:putative ABC transport system substrate-binding protein